jgi:FixJ family two-component response regulator
VIVEDDAPAGTALLRLLIVAGFDAELYHSAESLLESGALERAGCCIVDIGLPGMSGFELEETLARMPSPCPTVLITGDDSPWRRQRAADAEVAGYLVKPIPRKQLIDIIDACLKPETPSPGPRYPAN